jgi:diguanylate cyclase (GGDEF)-like protein
VKCPKCLNSELERIIISERPTLKCPHCGVLLASKQTTAVKKQDLVMQISKDCKILAYKGPLNDDMFIAGEKLLGKKIGEVLISEIAQPITACLEPSLQTLDMHFFEYFVNTNRFYEIRIIVIDPGKAVAIISNISEFRQAAKTVRHLAYHDPLTGLPNRSLFSDRLQQAIARAERENKMFAILFLDLDNFKHVNDTLGHKTGDELLKGVAERLRRGVRLTDSISHITEDFSFNIENVEAPAQVAGRILKILSEAFVIGPHEVFVTTSIGIAVFPLDGTHMDALLINADVAMYQAKNYGKNRYQYYSKSMNEYAHEKFTVETKLRKALSHGEFVLFYQPQVNIQTGELIGAEALIRWLQPDLVLTRPADFIPLAEQTGLIIPMGEWILRTVCEQSRLWESAGLKDLLITVNVSSIQFQQDNFAETLYKIMDDAGVEPGALQLELTETAIMSNSEKNIKKLLELQIMGFQISIDDFGTGYSSLKYLKHFPLSTLKIDHSFVRQLESNANDQSIVSAIITLAHNFNLKVIAEGVEKRGQLDFLKRCGCEGAQGYLICPPSNPDFLTEFMKKAKFI